MAHQAAAKIATTKLLLMYEYEYVYDRIYLKEPYFGQFHI